MNYEQPRLALLGGEQNIKYKFKEFNTIGLEEKEAAIEVIESGVLYLEST